MSNSLPQASESPVSMPENAVITPSVRNRGSDFYSMLTDLTLTQKRNRATQRRNA